LPKKKGSEQPLSDAEIADRMEKAIERSFLMPPGKKPPKKPPKSKGGSEKK
jgi:hypothetical protein